MQKRAREKYLAIEKTSRDELARISTTSPELEQKIKTLEARIEWWQEFMEEKVESVTRRARIEKRLDMQDISWFNASVSSSENPKKRKDEGVSVILLDVRVDDGH